MNEAPGAQPRTDQTPSVQGEKCARCGEAFHCGVDDPVPCPCSRIQVDATVLVALRQRYARCLCVRCLEQEQWLAQGQPQTAVQPQEPESRGEPGRARVIPRG
jgi:hypothetical protein